MHTCLLFSFTGLKASFKVYGNISHEVCIRTHYNNKDNEGSLLNKNQSQYNHMSTYYLVFAKFVLSVFFAYVFRLPSKRNSP